MGLFGRWKKQFKKQESPLQQEQLKDDVVEQKVQPTADALYAKGLQLQVDGQQTAANEAFTAAIGLSDVKNVSRFGIGVLHEQQGEWELAIAAYKEKLTETHNDSHLYYQLGILLKKLNRPTEAIPYIEHALEGEKVFSGWYYNLARCFEDIANYEQAAVNYQQTVSRQQVHRPEIYRRLAFCLAQTGAEKAALAKYREADLYRIPSNMSEKSYQKAIADVSVKYAMCYEFYEELNDKMVFYESMSGSSMMGNPGGVFDYTFRDEDFSDYIHIWVINDFEAIPQHYRKQANIIFVKRNSDAYLRYITTAKYLICDSVFAQYVVRKPGQKYLHTTHGIFYKTVGRQSANKEVGVAISTRNYLQATHLIVPNQFMVEQQEYAYSIKGIRSAKVAIAGYPRIDITLKQDDTVKRAILERLKINNGKANVLYAPTWRGTSKDNHFDVDKLVSDLEALARIDANILFRGHPITRSVLKMVKMPDNIIMPPGDISTNLLMSTMDVLISDYSSVFFDFIPTEKPIVHYLYDVDEYRSARGLNLSEEELPGFIAKTTEELVAAVERGIVDQTPSPRYLAAKARFCPLDKGRSGEAVALWFFKDDSREVELVANKEYRQKDLYLGGLLSDTTVLPSFVKGTKERQANNHLVTAMMRGGVLKDSAKKASIVSLGNDVNFVPYGPTMPKTLAEIMAIREFEKTQQFSTEQSKKHYQKAYQREWRRLFGDTVFDEVINLEKDSPFWSGVFEQQIRK
ncbi:CDP-glycerol glycerophosphotransferase family protein [Brochothrix campestris]|uniref:CDP-glycerol glycerophosphotransferase n=1 Tax=Brochothrix campestris FSL F6-1037 TaxID=1265861 RepID=W7CTT2_9LIST|nr:CDP-glycerol glycerophosphotransferase family protein [Brochothrix campestris]EUJ39241.1 CDP-glycerol glycerophosphotransferase [Brochothrix campestris FSL F6-1037]